ncbi:hypothetical protein Ait01nite_016300 [Actinoplanes italicus]|uniref:Uncharacterized protein n=1 Tax=Actinoplanes italicus TaxID=113567 RepID=A0A2T0JZ92_9ACTN|nr:hypothetical protein [Actinoplanes italicus]PRX15787.1 hypothetical protein CLV67_12226 [Actinoplanes italicus]GIE28585.1 hypothetical protein Ait01nite_016300 [Actinoplanes italicus]
MSYRTRFALVAVSLTVLLAGCSSGDEKKDTPQVATLQSSAAPSSAPASDQRPVYPIDATEEQIKAMAKPWAECLKAEGVKKPDDAVGLMQKGGTAKDLRLIESEDDAAAWKACEAKQPESFEQHQLRTSPTEFKDNQREWYRCAQAAGYKLNAPDPATGQFGLTEIGPNGDFGSEKMQECRRQAFAS